MSLARAYARLVINWDWRTLPRQLERAAPLATGALSHELAAAAASARADRSLRRDHPGSRGRVVSVTSRGNGSTRRLLVVTSEQASRAGRATIEGPRARVYVATTQRTRAGWRLVAWELEP